MRHFAQLSGHPAHATQATRRAFFGQCGLSIGSLGLASLLQNGAQIAHAEHRNAAPLAARSAELPARAKAIIYLFMAGGPSQLELFEDKPKLAELSGQPPPASFMRAVRRFFFMVSSAAEKRRIGSSRGNSRFRCLKGRPSATTGWISTARLWTRRS